MKTAKLGKFVPLCHVFMYHPPITVKCGMEEKKMGCSSMPNVTVISDGGMSSLWHAAGYVRIGVAYGFYLVIRQHQRRK